MEFITLADALHLADRLGFYVQDAGLLDSALARPASELFGVDAYPTLASKAAALHQSLIKNHALFDGNKRMAWILLNAFIELNGSELTMTTTEGMDFTLGVADGRYRLEQATALIAQHLGPLQ